MNDSKSSLCGFRTRRKLRKSNGSREKVEVQVIDFVLPRLRRMEILRAHGLRTRYFCIMNQILRPQDRRAFLRHISLAAAFSTVPGAFAEALVRTPPQTEGPFYPDRLPLDTDNDLLIVNDSITPAVGEVTWLSGRVLDSRGEPIRNALVEIWQCDASGVYLHTKSGGDQTKQDKNFQGFGRFLTGSTGEYVFRTIKPVPYN